MNSSFFIAYHCCHSSFARSFNSLAFWPVAGQTQSDSQLDRRISMFCSVIALFLPVTMHSLANHPSIIRLIVCCLQSQAAFLHSPFHHFCIHSPFFSFPFFALLCMARIHLSYHPLMRWPIGLELMVWWCNSFHTLSFNYYLFRLRKFKPIKPQISET